jgi:multiple sugar transport system substrate-binding protein
MRFTLTTKALALVLGAALVAGCSSGSDGGTDPGGGSGQKVTLTFWAWAPNIEKVVAKWNSSHPDIQVKVSKQAEGDEQVTKLLTAAKAGNPPDLAQVEYQALPTLVSNDVLADVTGNVGDLKTKFSEGMWQQVTLGTGATYGIPQDSGPMMLYYRKDLFDRFGLTVPKTWDEFAQTARQLRAKDPKRYLTTFSATDPGWFAGLSQQAGASWWSIEGETWKVSVNDEATQKVAKYWGDLVNTGVLSGQPMYTPAWNKALNDGTLLTWPSAVWAPGVLAGNAASTKGKWMMAPLPQWNAGEQKTGNWGGSSTGITAKSKNQKAATEFAIWMNTDPDAVNGLVTETGIYPAVRDAQSGPALQKPPAFFAQQTDFYPMAKQIADTAAGFTWGPNVNVTYSAYRDAFGKAITRKSPFPAAVEQLQTATITDMRKRGFDVAD